VTAVTANVAQQTADAKSTPVDVETAAEKAARENQKAAAIKAAVALLKSAEIAKAAADKRAKKLGEPYLQAKKNFLKATQGAEDVQMKLKAAEKQVEDSKMAKEKLHVTQSVQASDLKAAQTRLTDAKVKMVQATDAQKAAVKEADKAAANALDTWAAYLKAFADKKSSDAKAPQVTDLDPWNKALAEAAKPQKGAGGVDCTEVGNKFKTIIYLARDEFMKTAKAQCVAKGREWKESVQAEVDRQVKIKVAERMKQLQAKMQSATLVKKSVLEAAAEFDESTR
jgi:hypothetical protein